MPSAKRLITARKSEDHQTFWHRKTKLLAIIFAKEMRRREQVQQAVKRATQINVTLGGLRQPRVDEAAILGLCSANSRLRLYHVAQPVEKQVSSKIAPNGATVSLDPRPLGIWIRFNNGLGDWLITYATNPLTAQTSCAGLAARLSALANDHPARTAVERAEIRSRNIGLGHRLPPAKSSRQWILTDYKPWKPLIQSPNHHAKHQPWWRSTLSQAARKHRTSP